MRSIATRGSTRGGWPAWAKALLASLALATVAGCQTGQLPDPNDPVSMGGVVSIAVLRRNLDYANRMLEHRAEVGEISSEERMLLLQKYAEEMVQKIDVDKIPASQAWEYGDVFKTAGRWDLAKKAYEIAIENPRNEDRRVNDTLRLALCEAQLGNVERAIELTRSVFDTDDRGTAPILPAVLLEIVPAAEGKGYDGELADLLVDAIAQHERTIVDPQSEGGKAFFRAKPIHYRDAYRKAIALYTLADMPEKAEETRRAAQAALGKFGRA